jgi:hypothetical protein
LSPNIKEIREKIDAALAEVDAAETALATLLLDLRRAPRAEKVTVTSVVESAFQRLRTARLELAKLHEMLSDSE